MTAVFGCVLIGVLMSPSGVVSASASGETILYVDDDAPRGGDGQSWDTAYRYLQDALVHSGDGATEIRLAQGLYLPDREERHPDGTGDRFATFGVHDGVSLLGGFAGIGASDPNDRDPGLYLTMLSGDLLGNDDDDGTEGNDENSHHVVSITDVPGSVLIEGVVIASGHANGPGGPNLDGAGIKSLHSNAVIRDCRFARNVARTSFYPLVSSVGGGLYVEGGTLLVEGCAFDENIGGSGGGGGIYVGVAECVIRDCRFRANAVATNFGAPAISSWNSITVIEDCVFLDNVSLAGHGGAVGIGGHLEGVRADIRRCHFEGNSTLESAGALRINGPSGLIEDCVFLNNSAQWEGGAINARSFRGLEIRGCHFEGNVCQGRGGAARVRDGVVVDRCVFLENYAGYTGGAIELSGGELGSRLINLVIVRNIAPNGAGLHMVMNGPGEGSIAASNLTIIDNIAEHGGAGLAGEGMIANSIIRGNVPRNVEEHPQLSVAYSNVGGGEPGIGNFDADPMFIDALNDDYRIEATSPCCDRGWNLGAIRDVFDRDGDRDRVEFHPTDADGLPRFVDVGAPDLGCGVGSIVDVGAFEVQGGVATTMDPADLNGDGEVGVDDLLLLLGRFNEIDPCAVDVNGDLLSDLEDLWLLLDRWSVSG